MSRAKFRMALCLALLIAAIPAAATAWSTVEWEFPFPGIDSAGVGVDSEGNRHLVYDHNCSIYYRTDKGGGWATQEVVTPSGDTLCTDFIDAYVTPAGNVYFTYRKDTTSGVRTRFATNASGTWTSEKAVPAKHELTLSNVVIAARGSFTYVLYIRTNECQCDPNDTDPDGLYLRTYSSDGVKAERLSGSIGWAWPDLEVDSRGKLHIASTKDTFEGRGIDYLTNRSGEWKRTTLARSTSRSNQGPHLVIDGGRHVHVAWWRCEVCTNTGEPIYATNRSGNWERKVVGPSRGPGQVTGIDYSGGGVHIVWENLHEAPEIAYTTNESGSWVSKRWMWGFQGEEWYLSRSWGLAAWRGHPSLVYSLDGNDHWFLGLKTN